MREVSACTDTCGDKSACVKVCVRRPRCARPRHMAAVIMPRATAQHQTASCSATGTGAAVGSGATGAGGRYTASGFPASIGKSLIGLPLL
jgi:hypothetical protein